MWVPVDHCPCGSQLHELPNMVKNYWQNTKSLGIQIAQGYPSNKTFDPKPFMARRLQGEDRGQRGTGGFAPLLPAAAYAPVPVEIQNSFVRVNGAHEGL